MIEIDVRDLVEHPGISRSVRVDEPVEGLELELSAVPEDAPIEGEHRIGMGAPVANDSRAWLDRALRLFEDRHPSAARPSARHLGIEGDAASKEKP